MSMLLLVVAIAGLICSTGFLVLIVYSAIRFSRRPLPANVSDAQLPPVSVLKPLCGLEPDLERNLESFFTLDYPHFELVFGTRDAGDPALKIVDALRLRYPDVPVKIVFSGEPDRPNAKVCSLIKMYAAMSHDYLVIGDSDVRVAREYLREVIKPLLNPKVGLVTCIYRGVPTGGLWTLLEGLGMSVEMSSGVIVADLLEGMTFALGPSMSTRRDVVDSVGGLEILLDYLADDYVIGNEVHRAGSEVVLSHYIIDHVIMNRSMRSSFAHQIRWMRSTRFSRPAGHLGTLLTFAMPFGLLGLIGGLIGGKPMLGLSLLAFAYLNRLIMALVTGVGVVRDRLSLVYCWLYPLRDLTGFYVWCASYFGQTVVWRNEEYRVLPGGKMVRVGGGATAATQKESAVVGVDNLS
jgi:ceramide glucosyltransferase